MQGHACFKLAVQMHSCTSFMYRCPDLQPNIKDIKSIQLVTSATQATPSLAALLNTYSTRFPDLVVPSLTTGAGMSLNTQPASFPGLGQGPRSGDMPRQSFQVFTPSPPSLPGGASLRPEGRRVGSWASSVNQQAVGTGGRTVPICYKRVISATLSRVGVWRMRARESPIQLHPLPASSPAG